MGDVGLHAVHRLQVRLWVEVGVIEHDGVRRGEGDTQPARSRRAHEDLELAPLGVELLDVDLALHAVGGAVEPRVCDAWLGSALGLGLGLGLGFWFWFWFWLGLGLGVGLGLHLTPRSGSSMAPVRC